MIKYTIGELLSRFEKTTDLAFGIKGDCKGTLIFVDITSDDKLTNLHSDGFLTPDFNFLLSKKKSYEEAKEWIMVHELNKEDEEYEEIMNVINKNILVVWTKFAESFVELDEESKINVVELLSNQMKLLKDEKL